MFHSPNQYRVKIGRFATSQETHGNSGGFYIPSMKKHRRLYVIAGDGMGWEHVSVHAVVNGDQVATPFWDEMCLIKDLFWDEDDVVMQLHPARQDYVNVHPNVLHLWRPKNQTIPTPPLIMV